MPSRIYVQQFHLVAYELAHHIPKREIQMPMLMTKWGMHTCLRRLRSLLHDKKKGLYYFHFFWMPLSNRTVYG